MESLSHERAEDRLDSWKDIAAYLKRDVSTVQRWEKREGMPAHRHRHHKLGSVYAFRSELDAWWETRRVRLEAEQGAETPGGARLLRGWLIVAALGVVGLGAAAYLLLASRTDTARRPDVTSLAVLPLQNLSGDPTQDYFADA